MSLKNSELFRSKNYSEIRSDRYAVKPRAFETEPNKHLRHCRPAAHHHHSPARTPSEPNLTPPPSHGDARPRRRLAAAAAQPRDAAAAQGELDGVHRRVLPHHRGVRRRRRLQRPPRPLLHPRPPADARARLGDAPARSPTATPRWQPTQHPGALLSKGAVLRASAGTRAPPSASARRSP